jgi:hypothetical protein
MAALGVHVMLPKGIFVPIGFAAWLMVLTFSQKVFAQNVNQQLSGWAAAQFAITRDDPARLIT